MEIISKIAELKKSIEETDQLVEELISSLESQQLKTLNKEKKINNLQEEVKSNIKKIDLIIENYDANT